MSWSAADEEAAEAYRSVTSEITPAEYRAQVEKLRYKPETAAAQAAIEAYHLKGLAVTTAETPLLTQLTTYTTPPPVKEAAFQHIYLTAAEKAPLGIPTIYTAAQYEDVITKLVSLITPLVPYLTGKKKI